ncbi:MAG TPA: phage tail protein [Chitinophagaceae bacterium]|nr:phage tail protein [Chitinophagaceae bacterium]
MAEPLPYQVHQHVGFHFRVVFEGLKKDDGSAADRSVESSMEMRFQSVSGLDASLETESVKEGGENRFEHMIPTRRKYSPLVLKRGLLRLEDSALSQWFRRAFEDEKVEPLPHVDIQLLNEDHLPLLFWKAIWVWPKSWKVGELNAERGEVLIETLELNYNRFEFKNG